MDENAAEADKKAVLNASPVKAIEFFGALFSSKSDDSDIEDGASMKANSAQSVTSTSLRGGNWILRGKNKKCKLLQFLL